FRSSNNLRERLSNVQSLYGYAAKLEGLIELPDIVHAALAEARTILRCEQAELDVEQDGQVRRYLLDNTEVLTQEAVTSGDLERELIQLSRPRLYPTGHGDRLLKGRGFADLISVPLPFGDDDRAVLIAANRHGDGSGTFRHEDLSILQTLAAHLSTALTSSSRLDRLRMEVAAREHEASHDGLTGLANRNLFAQMVTEALERRSPSRTLAVMLMDLDGFKEINDTLGHHTGDAVLREVAWRVKAAVGSRQVAARLGGDEFAFLLPAATDLKDVTGTAERLLRAVAAPISVEGMVLSVHASIGVAIAPRRGGDASALLRRADVAMYSAKNSARGLAVYDPRIDHHSPRRLLLATELRRAVETHQGLDLWYQPVAALPGDEVVGFEALLRWNHPELGFLSPEEFIPVAEQSGLIEPLTWWVMRTAMHELQYWLSAGYPVTMAVNVSVRNLFDTAIVTRLRHLLDETRVPASSVILEITESSMMLDQSRSQGILRELSELGVLLAIDDFGTGYSSLSRLKELPVDIVKIDRSFVKSMCTNKGDRAIVRSTIELATVMGYGVVAEGVEDRETWDELGRLGCTHAQGFFLARPMTSQACRAWVRSGRPSALSAS
ncbi:MAG TPA: EAL domain-containing protein, partial [Acidimicrobiales bacterium]|nr:EAL domain-containing protein [Acidimicrobiales bacterium]